MTDRRAFDASGERKEAASEANAGPDKRDESGTAQGMPRGRAEPEPPPPYLPADFATLVLSLGSSAVAHLGEAPGPDGQKAMRNLPMAKHAIDLLSVLQEKTKGNLTPEEDQMLESLLFDLRLRYVEAVKPSTT